MKFSSPYLSKHPPTALLCPLVALTLKKRNMQVGVRSSLLGNRNLTCGHRKSLTAQRLIVSLYVDSPKVPLWSIWRKSPSHQISRKSAT